VRPGASGAAIDAATRKVIADAGFGEFFLHRTGHGIGMEAHEPPYIRDGNLAILEPGMAFTVEPGIYLPELGGVRIEDNVVMTKGGGETLTSLPRDLRVVGA
jgi:Xaa-Pro dipeptidase